jgi:hypothetical protein
VQFSSSITDAIPSRNFSLLHPIFLHSGIAAPLRPLGTLLPYSRAILSLSTTHPAVPE